jgi:hypothetical protein
MVGPQCAFAMMVYFGSPHPWLDQRDMRIEETTDVVVSPMQLVYRTRIEASNLTGQNHNSIRPRHRQLVLPLEEFALHRLPPSCGILAARSPQSHEQAVQSALQSLSAQAQPTHDPE